MSIFSHKIVLHLKLCKMGDMFFFSHFHNVEKITKMVPNHSTDTLAICGLIKQ